MIRISVSLALALLFPGIQAHAEEGLPVDAANLVKQFQVNAAVTRQNGVQAVQTDKDKLCAALLELQTVYTRAGKLDEAVAIRDQIRQLNGELVPPAPIKPKWVVRIDYGDAPSQKIPYFQQPDGSLTAPVVLPAECRGTPLPANAFAGFRPAAAAISGIEVEWGGSWWPAEVLTVRNGLTLIHYTGWASSWDEWIPPNRIEPAGAVRVPACGRPGPLPVQPARSCVVRR